MQNVINKITNNKNACLHSTYVWNMLSKLPFLSNFGIHYPLLNGNQFLQTTFHAAPVDVIQSNWLSLATSAVAISCTWVLELCRAMAILHISPTCTGFFIQILWYAWCFALNFSFSQNKNITDKSQIKCKSNNRLVNLSNECYNDFRFKNWVLVKGSGLDWDNTIIGIFWLHRP